ncbi:MAG: thioredoxin domain-containing protein [Gemmatimonadetes bacterium]|nr:thioredoxin domain-containing protein [Gemmatimonadota bacterium]
MTKSSRFETLSTAILVVCALVVTAVSVRRQLSTPSRSDAPIAPLEVRDWKRYVAGDLRIGAASSPVTIIEFSDFQCPFCRRLFQSVDRLLLSHRGDLQVVFRNYPLSVAHPQARSAAIAAECAAAAGRFHEYHDLLFTHQDSLASIGWSLLALRAGIADTTGFRRCLGDVRTSQRLLADSIAAAALRIRGTPTVLVNKWLFVGAPSDSLLELYVTRAISEGHQ